MSGYVSNFLDYTIDYFKGIKINNKHVTEDDVISVQVGSDVSSKNMKINMYEVNDNFNKKAYLI